MLVMSTHVRTKELHSYILDHDAWCLATKLRFPACSRCQPSPTTRRTFAFSELN